MVPIVCRSVVVVVITEVVAVAFEVEIAVQELWVLVELVSL